MKRHQIVWLFAVALLVLPPVQAEATSHTTSLTKLCTWIDCQAALAVLPKPKIEKGFPFSNVRPGGFVIIGGRRFGSTPGRLVLRLESLLSHPEVDLTHLEWSDKHIVGHIPCNMVTIPNLGDQPATLRVVAKNGAVSNAWPAQFSAKAVETLLPMRDTKTPSCSTEAEYNHCNDLADFGGDLVASGQYSTDETFNGGHSNAWGTGFVVDWEKDKGTDTYVFQLANGWVFTSLDFSWKASEGSNPTKDWVKDPTSFWSAKGNTSWSPSVEWSLTAWDSVWYHALVGICGPPGTKWK